MTMKRRTLLKSAVSGSALLAGTHTTQLAAMPIWKRWKSPAPRELVILKTATLVDEAFIKGIESAFGPKGEHLILTKQLGADEQVDPAAIEHTLSSLAGKRLIGLMEDVPFTLFQNLARSQGARFLFNGQHSWDGQQSHHQCLTVPQSQGISAGLAAALSADGQSFFISETSLECGRKTKKLKAAAPTNTGHWATAMGELLTTVSMGNWRSVQGGEFENKAPGNQAEKAGSLASFLVEL